MKVKHWSYNFCGNLEHSWQKAALAICLSMPEMELSDDIDEQAQQIGLEVERICKERGYDMNYWPDGLSIVPV